MKVYVTINIAFITVYYTKKVRIVNSPSKNKTCFMISYAEMNN